MAIKHPAILSLEVLVSLSLAMAENSSVVVLPVAISQIRTRQCSVQQCISIATDSWWAGHLQRYCK